MRKLVTITVPLLICIAGCGDTKTQQPSTPAPAPTTTSPNPQSTSTTSAPAEQPMAAPIPKDITYTIIDRNIVPGIKRSLDIRLHKKVSEEVLHSIAMKLKDADSNTYERTFIGYYLPDMDINAGYWATTHFNPDLEVRILGLTAEQEQALTQKPEDASRKIIGSWLDDRPFVGNKITIFRKDGTLYMENTYKDGSSGTKELVEKPSPRGTRFQDKEGSSFGEFYLIDNQGHLQLWDQDGCISTAKKLQ